MSKDNMIKSKSQEYPCF